MGRIRVFDENERETEAARNDAHNQNAILFHFFLSVYWVSGGGCGLRPITTDILETEMPMAANVRNNTRLTLYASLRHFANRQLKGIVQHGLVDRQVYYGDSRLVCNKSVFRVGTLGNATMYA